MNKKTVIKTFQFCTLATSILIGTSAIAEEVIVDNETDIFSSITVPDLVEPEGTYDTGTPSLLNMKLKTVILEGPCVADDYTGCTLNDVLNDVDTSDDFKPEIKVHMTADDFPDDGLEINAEMRQRGATSRSAPQKSFRVKLESSDDLWRGERRIQLVKSFYDFTRIRNKLSYDLMADIPNLISMRSQFVNLEVENEGTLENYGLYTQVEYFGKEYLLRRGWDDDSGVYKAEYFFFQDDPAFELDEEGEPIDEDAFEALLEIKRGKDHTQLVAMIKAVNNPELDFQTDVFDKYFNKENYLSWLASNILLGNTDTTIHNYYLYNPKDSSKFYFVPWDYDYLGGNQETDEARRENTPRAEQSHANWWFGEFHKQFLSQPGNLELLKDAVLELKIKYFSEQKIQDKLDAYYPIVFPQVSTSPDIDYTYIAGNSDAERIETYNRVHLNLVNRIEENHQLFLERFGDPMSFWMHYPYIGSFDRLTFAWQPSESLTGAQIIYNLEIATSPEFDAGSILRNVTLNTPKYRIKWAFPNGTYYYRAIARDAAAPEEFFQVANNQLTLANGQQYFGVREFVATQSSRSIYPVATPDIVSTPNDSALTIDVLANDEGRDLTLAAPDIWSRNGGNVALVDNKLLYTPKAGFVGEDKIWYVFNDSQGRSNSGDVTINVTEPETVVVEYVHPDGVADDIDATSNTLIIIDVLANDVGSNLTLTVPSPWSNSGGEVRLVDNKLTYISKADFIGEDKIWYVFNDPEGNSDFGEVTITVTSPAAQ